MKGEVWKEEKFAELHRGRGKLGFGFFIGLLLVVYGAYEIAKFYKWIPDVAFPLFPVFLLLIGVWMIAKRLMRN